MELQKPNIMDSNERSAKKSLLKNKLDKFKAFSFCLWGKARVALKKQFELHM